MDGATVGDFHVDALAGGGGDVLGDVQHLREAMGGRIAGDQLAFRVAGVGVAIVDDALEAERADRAGDIDVPVVHGSREA